MSNSHKNTKQTSWTSFHHTNLKHNVQSSLLKPYIFIVGIMFVNHLPNHSSHALRLWPWRFRKRRAFIFVLICITWIQPHCCSSVVLCVTCSHCINIRKWYKHYKLQFDVMPAHSRYIHVKKIAIWASRSFLLVAKGWGSFVCSCHKTFLRNKRVDWCSVPFQKGQLRIWCWECFHNLSSLAHRAKAWSQDPRATQDLDF